MDVRGAQLPPYLELRYKELLKLICLVMSQI